MAWDATMTWESSFMTGEGLVEPVLGSLDTIDSNNSSRNSAY